MPFKNIQNNLKRTGLDGDFISGKYEAHSIKTLAKTFGQGPIGATGGQTVVDGTTTYHVFIEPGTLTINSGSGNLECLIVAGGAGGGQDGYHSGGGGAGGVLYSTSFAVTEGNSFPVAVGGGGAPLPNISTLSPPFTYIRGNDGFPSHVGLVTASGGGGGGNYSGGAEIGIGSIGGSGGGGGWLYAGGASIQSPVGVFVGYGNPGGDGMPPPATAGVYGSGGGGGAGAVGGDGSPTASGNGGAGQSFASFPAPVLAPALTAAGVPAPTVTAWTSAVGPTGLFGGGGGGSTYDPSPTLFATGGPGGGGDGGNLSVASAPGKAYTGGGGGSSTHNTVSSPNATGGGGAGIVLVKYQSS